MLFLLVLDISGLVATGAALCRRLYRPSYSTGRRLLFLEFGTGGSGVRAFVGVAGKDRLVEKRHTTK